MATKQTKKTSSTTAAAQLPRVGFVSLGCPKNLVDSEVMMGILASNGAVITPHAGEADIIVVNTCSFIDTAKQESVDTILEMVRHKTEGRAKKLIVTGCLVERYRNEIQKSIPEIDAVLGTGELPEILRAAGIAPAPSASPFNILGGAHPHASASQQLKSGIEHAAPADHAPHAGRAEGKAREKAGRFARDQWQGAEAALPDYLYDENTPRLLATAKHSAYLKIAEGCDHPCAFCIIPQLRGKFRSRTIESVVAEARHLAAQGVREINLIGQDTTCFGEDLGIDDGLAKLLEALAQIDEDFWVRFLYAYPNKITPRLLEVLAQYPRLCRYIDVPLQHASTAVLKRMKRGGSAEIFLKLIRKIRQSVPGIALRTSFIVGFPGETEEDFQQLCDFVEQAQFDWMGVFSYSDEEGSPAYLLDAKVPPREIERRRRKLMQLQKRISRKLRKQWVGREIEVMLEGPSEETELLWEARTRLHAPEIDGKVFINDFGDLADPTPGQFHRAVVEEAHDYDLVARLV
ncbi:MAG: 30S ribosomal protein S12 methylthiotransferase RimO [Acidobacteriota bacterium]|nr:30S ribosomal protein S12 methylthiotransferase RimO [Acidobacteriota bacterium]